MTSKILKTYKILQNLAHLDVQLQQRRLRDLESQEREIEEKILFLQDQLIQERNFLNLYGDIDVSFMIFEKLIRDEISQSRVKLIELKKNIEKEKEILKDFFLEEKKFEHVYIQNQKKEEKEELCREILEIDDLILMRRNIKKS